MNPDDYCQQKAAAPGSALHYSTLYLDPPKRQALIALHAFRQEIHDVVSAVIDPEPAQAKLAWWRTEIGALFEDKPNHPVTRALSAALRQFPITQEPLLEVINGYEMDIHHGRYDDFKALQYYCDRVSGTISTVSSTVLGDNDHDLTQFAKETGLFLQLAIIIRNVGIDAMQGRIYLPLDELEQHGVTEDEILAARQTKKFSALLSFQNQRAKSHFANALSSLSAGDRSSQRAILAFANIQLALLKELERDRFYVLTQSTSLTPLRMLWIATHTWLRR